MGRKTCKFGNIITRNKDMHLIIKMLCQKFSVQDSLVIVTVTHCFDYYYYYYYYYYYS